MNIKWGDYGFFTRGIAFYDAIADRNRLADASNLATYARPYNGRLRPNAQDETRHGAEILDWYAYATFYPFGNPLNIRAGNQVITWGEALVTQNAINIINPLDLQKFTVPGAEIRDGLVPVQSVFASYEVIEGLTVEGFYVWDFTSLRLNPAGTFFAGGIDAYGAGAVGDNGVGVGSDCILPEAPAGANPAAHLPCLRTTWERDDGFEGDWGFAVRYFSPELNNSDLAFYWARYTDRFGGFSIQVPNVLTGTVTDYANSTTFRDFPQRTTLYGFSFNTLFEQIGTSFAGEVSFKKDAPALVDNGNVWFANFITGLGTGAPFPLPSQDANAPAFGSATPGQIYAMARPIDTWNVNLRALKILTSSTPLPVLIGSDDVTVIVEASANFADIPESGQLPFGPGGTYAGTNQPNRWASSFSWGYTLIANASYPAAFGPINLNPGIAFSHGVQGITPTWGGWQEKVKAINFSLQGQYLLNTTATVNYAHSWDGGYHRGSRNFIGLTINHQF